MSVLVTQIPRKTLPALVEHPFEQDISYDFVLRVFQLHIFRFSAPVSFFSFQIERKERSVWPWVRRKNFSPDLRIFAADGLIWRCGATTITCTFSAYIIIFRGARIECTWTTRQHNVYVRTRCSMDTHSPISTPRVFLRRDMQRAWNRSSTLCEHSYVMDAK